MVKYFCQPPTILLLTLSTALLLPKTTLSQLTKVQDLVFTLNSPLPCSEIVDTHRIVGNCCSLNSTVGGGCVLTVANGNCQVTGQEWTVDLTSTWDDDVCPATEYFAVPRIIEVNDWAVPSGNAGSLLPNPRFAQVGDIVQFNWIFGRIHNVFIHPNNNCDLRDRIEVGLETGAQYKFTTEDANNPNGVFFACDAFDHCNFGQHVTFMVSHVPMLSSGEEEGAGVGFDTNTTNTTDITNTTNATDAVDWPYTRFLYEE